MFFAQVNHLLICDHFTSHLFGAKKTFESSTLRSVKAVHLEGLAELFYFKGASDAKSLRINNLLASSGYVEPL